MEVNKKINLSAMMKKPGSEQEKLTTTAIVIDDTSQEIKGDNAQLHPTSIQDSGDSNSHAVKKAGVTIDISSIKSEHKTVEVVEEKKVEEEKDEQTLFYESLTSRVFPDEQNIVSGAEENKKISLKTIKKSDGEQNIKNTISRLGDDSFIIVDDEGNEKEVCDIAKHVSHQLGKGDLFSNYESDYKKKEGIVIETIHKLKKISDIKKLTKTNKVFVVSIIMATTLGISFLFYIDPETHSLENYKTSILTVAGREVTQQELIVHQTNIENDIQWQLNKNRLGGYKLDFEMLANENGEAIYKFDGLEYTTKELLDIAITEKLIFLKKEKIKDYLKNETELSQ